MNNDDQMFAQKMKARRGNPANLREEIQVECSCCDGTGKMMIKNRCAYRESGGVQCEGERGHEGPHNWDWHLNRWLEARYGTKP